MNKLPLFVFPRLSCLWPLSESDSRSFLLGGLLPYVSVFTLFDCAGECKSSSLPVVIGCMVIMFYLAICTALYVIEPVIIAQLCKYAVLKMAKV